MQLRDHVWMIVVLDKEDEPVIISSLGSINCELGIEFVLPLPLLVESALLKRYEPVAEQQAGICFELLLPDLAVGQAPIKLHVQICASHW